MWENLSLIEESKVLEFEYCCPSFLFVRGCTKILARPHCEKYCNNTKLSYGNIFYDRSFQMKLTKGREGGCFLLHYIFVLILVAAVFLLMNIRQSSAVILSWVCPVIFPEGLCHVVDGGTYSSLSQGSVTRRRVDSLYYCLGKGEEEEV